MYRLNIGLSRDTFRSATSNAAPAPDYSAFDELQPHPNYASQAWVCIVSPSQETFNSIIQPLLSDAYGVAVKRLRR